MSHEIQCADFLTCEGEFAILKVHGLQDPAQADSGDATVGLAAWDRRKTLAFGSRRTNPPRVQSY